MNVADEPAIINVPHDVLDRIEGMINVGRIVHGKNDAGNDLRDKAERQNAAESPPVINIFWGRIIGNIVMHKTHYWQARIHPAREAIRRFICALSTHKIVLSNFDACIANEFIWRNFQVFGGWAFADAAGSVVMRTVAGAEPTVKIACLTERNAT